MQIPSPWYNLTKMDKLLLTLSFCLNLATPLAQAEIKKLPQAKAPRVLLLLAHPDDETMLGGTLIHLREIGAEIFAMYMTDGEGGKIAVYKKDGTFTMVSVSPEKLKEIRHDELKKADDRFGFEDYQLLGQPDQPLRDPVTQKPSHDAQSFMKSKIWDINLIKKKITSYAEKVKPDLIVTMSLDSSVHAHHKTVRMIAQELFNAHALGPAKSLFAIEETHWVLDGTKEPRGWIYEFNLDAKYKDKTYADAAFYAASAHESQQPGHTGPLHHKEILYCIGGEQHFL